MEREADADGVNWKLGRVISSLLTTREHKQQIRWHFTLLFCFIYKLPTNQTVLFNQAGWLETHLRPCVQLYHEKKPRARAAEEVHLIIEPDINKVNNYAAAMI